MATVKITIIDQPDDLLKISIESDPPFPGPADLAEKYTAAQETGWELFSIALKPDGERSEESR